jgi:hypothetical protein
MNTRSSIAFCAVAAAAMIAAVSAFERSSARGAQDAPFLDPEKVWIVPEPGGWVRMRMRIVVE